MTQKTIPGSGSALRFRRAADADCSRLIFLINSAFGLETFLDGNRTDEGRLAAMMAKGSILVAEDLNGQPLACVYLELRVTELGGRRGYLGQLAVDPAHQRSGLGRAILEAGEEELRRQGCTVVDITVLSLRPELLPIYRRWGYVETGTEEFKPSRPLRSGMECHCIVLSKNL